MRFVGLTGIAACLAMAGCAPYPYGYYAARQPYLVTPGAVPPYSAGANPPAAESGGVDYAQPDLLGTQPAYPQPVYPVPAYDGYAPQGYYGYAPSGGYGYSPPYLGGFGGRPGGDRERYERERSDRDRRNREQADRDRFTRDRFERDRANQEQRDRDLIRERVLRAGPEQPGRPLEGPARGQDFRRPPPPAPAPARAPAPAPVSAPASAPQRPPQPQPGPAPGPVRRLIP